jgi:hypothetical protein
MVLNERLRTDRFISVTSTYIGLRLVVNFSEGSTLEEHHLAIPSDHLMNLLSRTTVELEHIRGLLRDCHAHRDAWDQA